MRILVINNPRSGQSGARRYALVAELCDRGVEVVVRAVDEPGSIEAALHDAHDFDRVVTIGGDGTASTAAYALRDSGVPLLPYPAGTANALALNLGIPADPVRCADTLLGGRIVRVDMGEITYDLPHRRPSGRERRSDARPARTGRSGFTNIAGAGFDAAMVTRGEELKSQFGAGAYLLAALQNPEPTMASIDLLLDGQRVETEGSGVLLVNFGRIQFDITVTHDSDAQDGLLEVVVIKAKRVTDLLPAVIASYLDRVVTHPDRSQMLDTYRAAAVEVVCDPPLPLQADGDVLHGLTPLRGRILRGAATYIVARDVALPGVAS